MGSLLRQGVERARVLLVDDDRAFVDAVEALLSDEDGLEVVARAPNGAEALRAVEEVGPDLIVMDIEMPVLDGLSAARRLRDLGSRAKVLLVTGSDVEAHANAAHAAGAVAYLRKERIADLAALLRAVARS